MKAAADWFRQTVFKDEAIRSRPAQQRPAPPRPERLPSLLRAARSLENRDMQYWQSRSALFLQQAKLLANYEDDYAFTGHVQCYYPTYQSLTDQELRGYFSWRTRLRRGEVEKTSLSFAFLYIYELINQVGAADAMDGYRKLKDFRDAYGPIDDAILSYLDQWLVDYVIYYGLDAALLSNSSQVLFDRSVAALEHVGTGKPEEVIAAVKHLAPKWLGRSKFYAAHGEEMDAVIVPVLRRMSDHYAARCQKTLVEQYFGCVREYQARLFEAAVFCDPLKRRNYEYAVDEQCICLCKKGVWSAQRRAVDPTSGAKLEALLKTIDAEMRQAWGDRYPVKAEVDTKWILRIIREEIQKLLDAKQAAEASRVTIDYAQLTRIRRDAAVTQEKLIVDEETDGPEEPAPPEPEPALPEEPQNDSPLSPAERRFLQCLLRGEDLGWVREEGLLPSVLTDGINEKLYDVFGDTVLDEGPQVIEDYIEDLKEMVCP